MDRPLIGAIRTYGFLKPLEAAGAEVVSVSDESDLEAMDCLDGIVFGGGSDISPLRYGVPKKEWDYTVYGVDKGRDDYEFRAIERAKELGLSMMGVCRGAQLINVAHGGTLHQDLWGIEDESHWGYVIPAFWRKRAQAASCLSRLEVNASHFHHQAVDRVGEGLIAAAWSEEGIVEAIESADPSSPYILGTQFHPEMDWMRERDCLNLFRYFVSRTEPRSVLGADERRKEFRDSSLKSWSSGWSSTPRAKDSASVFEEDYASLDSRWKDDYEGYRWEDDIIVLGAKVPDSQRDHEEECDLLCPDGGCWDTRYCDPAEGECVAAEYHGLHLDGGEWVEDHFD